MRRKISFYRSNARAAIPTGYYRDTGSPPYFQIKECEESYLLIAAFSPLENCLPVREITIKSVKQNYLQFIVYIPVWFAGGRKQGRLIDDWIEWKIVRGSLIGSIKKLTPGQKDNEETHKKNFGRS